MNEASGLPVIALVQSVPLVVWLQRYVSKIWVVSLNCFQTHTHRTGGGETNYKKWTHWLLVQKKRQQIPPCRNESSWTINTHKQINHSVSFQTYQLN